MEKVTTPNKAVSFLRDGDENSWVCDQKIAKVHISSWEYCLELAENL